MAEWACASLILTSFNDVRSLVCVDTKYLNWSTSSNTFPFIHILVDGPGLYTADEDFAFVGADTSSSCSLQLFSELLEFFSTASQKIDIVSKPQVSKWSSSDGHNMSHSKPLGLKTLQIVFIHALAHRK